MSGQETIASRFIRLNQLILGKSSYNLPNKYLVHRDGLLDVLFALYEECNVDYMRRDKHIASFVDKFKGLMIELKSLRINLKDFEVKKIIGRGHFGEVQVVREKGTGDVYAMKVLRKQDTLSQQNVAFYKEERDIMSQTTSPWLTKLQYAFQDSYNLYLVMEFHPGGDMLSLLEKYDNILPEDMCQFYLAELVLAIHSLHSMGYVHRDIKPDNILIDRTGHIKLADFGSASKLNPHKQVTSSMPVGTPDYVAPEVLSAMNPGPVSSKSYGIECDWWSLGVVTYEMVFGSTPFADEKVLITYNNIMNFKNSLQFPEEASEVSELLINLIKGLLQEAVNRLGYEQLIVHPFFTDIDWNNIQHTAPPYMPTVTSVDDTSNFDEFEPESRPYLGDLKYKKEFSGKNLPFVGFTYSTPFERNAERMSGSSLDIALMSPTSSFCDPETSSKKKEITALQGKISNLLGAEETSKEEINKLKSNLEVQDAELSKSREEKKILEQLVTELNAEVKQVNQLLVYEREHRVISEEKASQIVRCMRTKQKLDALRLRAKSMDFNNGKKESKCLEEQLIDAQAKIDDFVRERIELLEDLEATKHMLLACQRKYNEKRQSNDSEGNQNESMNSEKSSENSVELENKLESETHDFKRLIFKLEKKNIELERELEQIVSAKKEVDLHNVRLQNAMSELECKIKQLEKEVSEMAKQKSNNQNVMPREKCEENTNLEILKTSENKKDLSKLSFASVQSIHIEAEGNLVTTQDSSRRVLQDVSNNQKLTVCLEDTSDLKQENEYLKTKIDVLNSELKKLKEDIHNKENPFTDLEKQLKEKENALSEAKIDLKISKRKEQQAESITSSLRERNKELREKIKSLEDTINEKVKIETELRQQVEDLESKLSEKTEEATEKQKLLEIEKTRHEERVKAMQYTCEISKNVTENFAKSRDHYEELIKQNMDLIKEKEEKNKIISHLQQEIKTAKDELTKKKTESAKSEKIISALKSTCVEMEEELKDLEIIVEARGRTIHELEEHEAKLKLELKGLEEGLKHSKNDMEKTEMKCEELVKHIEELNSEMDNNNLLLETEVDNVQDQLTHYKKIIQNMEEQHTVLQKELSMQNKDCKSYSEKIVSLESQLCEIKEEAARHITQISSLKSSNLKLTQALEEALEDNGEAKQKHEELYNELESMKAAHSHEKVKLQETLAQQAKLIDFLQSKTENMEKRKKPHISRLFGIKKNPANPLPIQHGDETERVMKQLERERSRCHRLQDQLSQARAENVALQRELSSFKNLNTNVEIPVSPVSRAMHCAITQSPSTNTDMDSPVLISKELVNKLSKPPGMKHKIPHRFTNILCMRSSKCCACLDSLHFGRHVAKCQECSVVCHPTCAASLPSTCGLPFGFMQHFKTAINDCPSLNTTECSRMGITEGWIKVPKNNKLGWDRRYLRIVDNILYLFENAEETDSDKALIKLDFSPKLARIVVTSAVSATEVPYAAASDLPYVLKLEYFPHTTCWPQRCLCIMALNFSDKQMWVSTLESLAEENITEIDGCGKNKLIGKAVWTLKGDTLMDPLCTFILDDNFVLLGAVDGLYVLKIVNKFTCSLKSKINGLQYVYQIACMRSIGLMIMIQGNERRLTMTQLSIVQNAVQKPINNSLISKPLSDISDCHLFSIEDIHHSNTPYLCIATSKSIMLYQWDEVLKTFCPKKVIETKEPCSCIHFTQNSIIFGTDSFYELNLSIFTVKKFLDDRDASLAGLIYGASQFRSFPIAIFQVSASDEPIEYLMCFHEMGVFVNGDGQRTRPDDMKWSRLPLSFAYQLPYLFVTHFNSIEVIEVPPQTVTLGGVHDVMLIQNPQYLGPAHIEQSIYMSSWHDQVVELILVDGKSVGRSDFCMRKTDCASIASCNSGSSGKESVTESDGLDFSFSTSIDQSLELSVDQASLSSKESTESVSSQS